MARQGWKWILAAGIGLGGVLGIVGAFVFLSPNADQGGADGPRASPPKSGPFAVFSNCWGDLLVGRPLVGEFAHVPYETWSPTSPQPLGLASDFRCERAAYAAKAEPGKSVVVVLSTDQNGRASEDQRTLVLLDIPSASVMSVLRLDDKGEVAQRLFSLGSSGFVLDIARTQGVDAEGRDLSGHVLQYRAWPSMGLQSEFSAESASGRLRFPSERAFVSRVTGLVYDSFYAIDLQPDKYSREIISPWVHLSESQKGQLGKYKSSLGAWAGERMVFMARHEQEQRATMIIFDRSTNEVVLRELKHNPMDGCVGMSRDGSRILVEYCREPEPDSPSGLAPARTGRFDLFDASSGEKLSDHRVEALSGTTKRLCLDESGVVGYWRRGNRVMLGNLETGAVLLSPEDFKLYAHETCIWLGDTDSEASD